MEPLFFCVCTVSFGRKKITGRAESVHTSDPGWVLGQIFWVLPAFGVE